jgi:hypothetical protein
MTSTEAPRPIKKRKAADVRWCGDVRTVLESPFDAEPDAETSDAPGSGPAPTKSAA